MMLNRQRIICSLIGLVVIIGLAALPSANGGIWDRTFGRRTSADARKAPPSPEELQEFFIDSPPESPERFEAHGNETAIHHATVKTVTHKGTATVADDSASAHNSDYVYQCTARGCEEDHHSWWCRSHNYWVRQSELFRTRRIKNSRNLTQKSYYETVPAYNVQNHGVYRTCWRKLRDCECCPEDVSAESPVPAPEHASE